LASSAVAAKETVANAAAMMSAVLVFIDSPSKKIDYRQSMNMDAVPT
jgi:hypothetical protein